MKPKPQFSVRELTAPESEAPTPILPYDTYIQDHASFFTFALGDQFVSLPLANLGKASLRAGAKAITLDFGTQLVRIDGRGLDLLFECILRGQVRVVRVGNHPACVVESIRLSETTTV